MRAIQIHEYGGPEVLLRLDIDIPTPGPGQVRVRLRAAGINFMDIHTRQGKYRESRSYPVRIPCTLGMEGAGVVDDVGDGVVGFAPGQRVAWCISWGAYADYAIVPAARLAHVPDSIDDELAAAVVFQGSTAHYLIEDVGQLAPGSTCLIQAASGGIGQLLVQLAKRRGATVFAITSTSEKAAVARAQGADHTLFYEDGAFADKVRELTGGRGVDVVYDAVGPATLRDSFRATKVRGLVVNFGSVTGPMPNLDPYELGEAGSLFLTRPRLTDHMADGATVQRRADDIFAALDDGSLRVNINGRYTFDDVELAHEALEARRQVGKAVMVFD